jgi:preprotein translocase subunit YajC
MNAAGTSGIISMILPFAVLFAVMYFMIIRPQKKREKLTKQMLDGLVMGDKILTIGGVIGKIVSIKDDTICIETGKAGAKSTVTFKRSAVSEVLKAAPDTNEQYDEGQYDIPTEE